MMLVLCSVFGKKRVILPGLIMRLGIYSAGFRQQFEIDRTYNGPGRLRMKRSPSVSQRYSLNAEAARMNNAVLDESIGIGYE
jgi:hypothetical protein